MLIQTFILSLDQIQNVYLAPNPQQLNGKKA